MHQKIKNKEESILRGDMAFPAPSKKKKICSDTRCRQLLGATPPRGSVCIAGKFSEALVISIFPFKTEKIVLEHAVPSRTW